MLNEKTTNLSRAQELGEFERKQYEIFKEVIKLDKLAKKAGAPKTSRAILGVLEELEKLMAVATKEYL